MMSYKVIKESAEISMRDFKEMGIIDAYTTNGVLNGVYDVIGTYSTLEDAQAELNKYKIVPNLVRGWANVKFIESDIYMIAEYDDDDWTGEMWFADEQTEEDNEEE